MQRLVLLLLSTICATLVLNAGTRQQGPRGRQVAITFDDLPFVSATTTATARQAELTDKLLASLGRHQVPAIGFVNEGKLYDRAGAMDPNKVMLLERWLGSGLELGNHTFSHLDLHGVTPDQFKEDVLRGEKITRALAEKAGRPFRFFRHPYLHTGRSREVREAVEAFLTLHGYRIAPVTFDNYDYVFARAYDGALTREPDAQRTRTEFLAYIERVVAYYEQQSRAIVGREIPQILLLHANALNADTFDQTAEMLRRRGYSFVTLDAALADPAYSSRDMYFGAGGITWLHRWALTHGQRGKFFAGEPEVPPWIQQAADAVRK